MQKYLQPICEFLEKNDWIENESEFTLLQYDVVDMMEEHQVGVESIQPIFELMEKHALVEFGSPGPLTHFIEKFYRSHSHFYETLLLQSLERQPSIHTIWLLNRVINGREEESSKELVQLLKDISENQSLHREIRAVAANFLQVDNRA